ncbi:PREDICTED: uncharacterized protein LOC105950298 [Erythranthe guttata]|uniref:uncharacterized protein LOC105950298 n=1 Tax=Erythranthe guttata TaxID=4155 RepID=UPI00064D744F|nr:PREDICTED: uncharacterized protein LOC105950298 [Erythranthe guttata]|eukprot:XP_012829106.1 PREDICTED: uncharacterized protein LOC105950298 [Erythranthe guttata]
MTSPAKKLLKTGETTKKAQPKEKAPAKGKAAPKKKAASRGTGSQEGTSSAPPPSQVPEEQQTPRTGNVQLEMGSRANQHTILDRVVLEPGDEFLYVNVEAKREFIRRHSRPFVPERELDIYGMEKESIIENFDRRQWKYLAKRPEDYNENLVRLFYANAGFHPGSVVVLRDIEVRYDAATINKFFHLPEVSTEPFQQLKMATTYEELIQTLCPRGSKWQKGEHWFRRGELSREAKVWMYFVSSRLMPTKSTAKTYAPRLTLMYAIMKRTPVNVGAIIHAEIRRCLGDTSLGLMFPSLITTLCDRAGVPTYADDRLTRSPQPIFPYHKLQPASGPLGEGDSDLPDAGPSGVHAARPEQRARRGRQEAEPQLPEYVGQWMDVMEENVGWFKKMMKAMAAALQCRTDDIVEPRPFPPRPRYDGASTSAANEQAQAAATTLVAQAWEEYERGRQEEEGGAHEDDQDN